MKKAFGLLGDVSNLRVLDVGCGTGRWSVTLAKMGSTVTGIDISSKMIELAKERATKNEIRNITFLNTAAEESDYTDYFDLALSATVLQHITDDKRLELAVQRMVNAVKKKGRILIIESASLSRGNRAKEEQAIKFMVIRTRQKWIDLFQDYGAKVVTFRQVWFLVPRIPILYNRFGNKVVGEHLERLAQFIDGGLAECWYLQRYSKGMIFLFEKK